MSEKYTPILIVLLIIASFAIGSMYTKIQYLQAGSKVAGVQTETTAPTQPTQQTQPAQPQPPTVTIDKIKALFSKDHVISGDANKKVIFVEISDPSCPFCHFAGGQNPQLSKESGRFQYVSDGGSYNPPVTEMKKLVESGKAGYIWLYSNGHGNGELASQAFYCANEKGQFWPVHDRLMSKAGYDLVNNVVKNSKEQIPQLVNFLSSQIDSAFMTTCLQSGKYALNLQNDQKTAQELGFQGTPHFFVNEKPFGGAVDYKSMEPTVTSLL